ncbi:cytochrome b/b6 domain-containing protein [Acidocella sp.]|uniref:cytochrome b/b6 domain-containing protein n=1 Tax=Acidocella sp. TaxID=50710 RepID=UPI002631A75C|nr:cytochrome b/b6 domain-containing protein [Acidocella sp.]
MSLITPRQILARALFSPKAVYRAAGQRERRSLATRLLHGGLLLSVIGQLASSEFMSDPVRGQGASGLLLVHEYAGLGSAALVTLFWLWALFRHGETKLARLVPWFSARAIRAVGQDALSQARGLWQGELVSAPDGALASAIHGLGLLTVAAMAITGTVYFLWPAAAISGLVLDVHSTVANLMWAYLLGHAAMAALHHLLGEDIVLRMFGIGRGVVMAVAAQGPQKPQH